MILLKSSILGMQLNTWHKNDLPKLVEIAAQAMPFSWPLKVFQDCFAADYVGWVLQEDKKIVGFIIIFVQSEFCEIINIAILPSYQHRGLGRQLMAAVQQYCESMQIAKLTLEVRKSNRQAIKFYRQLGFSEALMTFDNSTWPVISAASLTVSRAVEVGEDSLSC
jgi:ribosomal-protein-alanine N-acetyltransferase